MQKTWYLHYDDDYKPAGFSKEPPADIPFIMISEADKNAIEESPLSFIVLSGSLCRLPSPKHDPADYFRKKMSKAPKVAHWSLATDSSSILMALTGFNTGKEFYIRIITERGNKVILVPKDKRLTIMDVYHSWLVNNNLKETQ